MPGVIRLNKKELEHLITQIENNGGNAAELREFSKGIQRSNGLELSPEEYVEEKKKLARIKQGELSCLICKRHVSITFEDVCEECFKEWVLSIVKSKKERAKF